VTRYLVIHRLRVAHANALSAWWLMATPSPMTLYGFSRAVSLQTKTPVHRFAITHHDVQWLAQSRWNSFFEKKPYGGREEYDWDYRFWNQKILPQQAQGSTFFNERDHIGSGFAKGLQPTARAHFTLSLVWDVGPFGSVDIEAIQDFLWSGRMGGGSIVDHGTVKICQHVSEVHRAIGGGFWVVDRRDLVEERMRRDGCDGAEAMVRLLAEHRRMPEDEKNSKKAPWLSPNVVGYAALEAPTTRVGVRQGVEHAYAEPLVGLTQYQPLRRSERIPFWQYRHSPETRVFLTTGDL